MTAAVSHLPHIVASSLVNLVKDSDSQQGLMKRLAAGGFKDITRIASSSPEMWEQICMTNQQNLSIILEGKISRRLDIGTIDLFPSSRGEGGPPATRS